MELLQRSCNELGQTLVIVTHDAKASAYADRVVFLRDGKIIEQLVFEADIDLSQRVRQINEILENIEF